MTSAASRRSKRRWVDIALSDVTYEAGFEINVLTYGLYKVCVERQDIFGGVCRS